MSRPIISTPTTVSTTDRGATRPLVQVAIDLVDPAAAADLARAAHAAGADWLEIGKPFVEINGLRAARDLVAAAPRACWLVDLMVMAGAPRYISEVAALGAEHVTVTGLAPQRTVEETIRLGHEQGVSVTVDLFNVADPVAVAQAAEAAGAPFVMVHVGVDQKRHGTGQSGLETLRQVVAAVSVPVSYAVYDLDEARAAVAAGAAVVVQGEPLTSVPDVGAALTQYVDAVHGCVVGEGGRA